jgi:hypothetical protein
VGRLPVSFVGLLHRQPHHTLPSSPNLEAARPYNPTSDSSTQRPLYAPAGNEFGVSDIAVGSYLLYIPLFFPDAVPVKQANVWAYMKRLAARDACPASYRDGMAAAAAKEGGGGIGGLFRR